MARQRARAGASGRALRWARRHADGFGSGTTLLLQPCGRVNQRDFAEQGSRLAVQTDLDDVGPKQQGESPVDHNAQPPAPTGHLQQVIGAANKPRRDAMHPDFEELTKTVAMAQGAHHSESAEDEWLG